MTKEDLTATLLKDFIEDIISLFLNPSERKQNRRVSEQNPLAPTSTAKKFTFHYFEKLQNTKSIFLQFIPMRSLHIFLTRRSQLHENYPPATFRNQKYVRSKSRDSKIRGDHKILILGIKRQFPIFSLVQNTNNTFRHRRTFTTGLKEINGIIFRQQRRTVGGKKILQTFHNTSQNVVMTVYRPCLRATLQPLNI